MTTGQYILMYSSKTWTKNRWDENRISAAKIKITGGYINLVCKRYLDNAPHNQSWNWEKTKTSMKKPHVLNSRFPTQRMILANTTNAGMRHDGLHKPKCIYL
jgi:hypothetical protein